MSEMTRSSVWRRIGHGRHSTAPSARICAVTTVLHSMRQLFWKLQAPKLEAQAAARGDERPMKINPGRS